MFLENGHEYVQKVLMKVLVCVSKETSRGGRDGYVEKVAHTLF